MGEERFCPAPRPVAGMEGRGAGQARGVASRGGDGGRYFRPAAAQAAAYLSVQISSTE
ncbi:hypothetical protein ACVWXB_002183 [Streptomyces sp. TE12347]